MDTPHLHVLIVYATKRGSTREIAEAIAREIEQHGLRADCVDAGCVGPRRLDAVILWSAVYMKHWRAEARRLMRELASRPLVDLQLRASRQGGGHGHVVVQAAVDCQTRRAARCAR
jgi:hypothetical protein